MEFPWRCNVDTIAMDLKVSWGMSVETLPAALVVLIAAELSDRANEFTSYGGWIWFASRVVYLPAYASGIPLAS